MAQADGMDRERWKKLWSISKIGVGPRVDRRQHRRYLLRLELLEVNGKSVAQGLLLDLSASGARLDLPFSPPMLSPLSFKIQLPETSAPLTLAGRVIWSKPALERGRFFVGLQFYQLHWELERLLEKICS